VRALTRALAPAVLKICITSYPPFTYYVPKDLLPEPVAYSLLKSALPTPRENVSSLPSTNMELVGFDIDMIHLIFERMLGEAAGWTIQFETFNSFTAMWLGLLADVCHVAITASQMDPSSAFCPEDLNATKLLDYTNLQDYEYGDYGSDYGLPATGAHSAAVDYLSCLQYGAPYISSGFALLSVVNASPFDIMSSLFNADVCNAVTVIVIIACSCGFLVSFLERNNKHVGTLSRGAYWGLMTFLNSSEEGPRMKSGRIVMIVYMMSNLISVSIITSIISAKLTTASLSVTVVDTLRDVKGTLCVESNYDVLRNFVKRDPNRPVSMVEEEISDCITMLMNGTVAAVITDRTVLGWYSTYYMLSGLHLGPVLQGNPFAFVYKDAELLNYVNPAVIAATQTDGDWLPAVAALQVKYFGSGESAESAGPAVSVVDRKYLAIAAGMAGAAFLVAIVNGDWGPGIPSPLIQKYLGKPTKSDMSDEDAALAGDDQAMVRLQLKLLRELASNLHEMQGDISAIKARLKRDGGAPGSRAGPPSEAVAPARVQNKRIEAWVMDSAGAEAATQVATRAPSSVVYVAPEKQQRYAPAHEASYRSDVAPGFCGLGGRPGDYTFPMPFQPQPAPRAQQQFARPPTSEYSGPVRRG